MAIEIPIPRVEAFRRTISQDETQRANRPNQPSLADAAAGLASLRACRGVVDGLPVMVRGSVISAMIAEFLACFPDTDNSRGEILRILTAQANAALELITSQEPPPDAAA